MLLHHIIAGKGDPGRRKGRDLGRTQHNGIRFDIHGIHTGRAKGGNLAGGQRLDLGRRQIEPQGVDACGPQGISGGTAQ